MTIFAKGIDAYIAVHPIKIRVTLEKIRQTIKKAAPEAREIVSYGMPAFKFHGMLVWYSAFKDHYSLFFRSSILQEFGEEVQPYKSGKATLRFPIDKPVPFRLITKMTKFSVKRNLEKGQLLKTIKK